jgi:hypothetical protein
MLNEYSDKSWHDKWWALPAQFIALIVASIATVYVVDHIAPDADDRFDKCMARAERGGLSEAARDEAILLCLDQSGG